MLTTSNKNANLFANKIQILQKNDYKSNFYNIYKNIEKYEIDRDNRKSIKISILKKKNKMSKSYQV